MEIQKSLEELGYFFYEVKGTDVQFCITTGTDWKQIQVFKFENGRVVEYPIESNQFHGERPNRNLWSQLGLQYVFGLGKAMPIDEKKANSVLKEYVKDYLSNR